MVVKANPSVTKTVIDGPQISRGKLEALAFLILAVLIWPVIAVGIVAGWGFAVWMYFLFTGPPGPV